jgi:hypothetical protein
MEKRHPFFYRIVLFALIGTAAVTALSGCNYKRQLQDSTYDYGSRQKGDPKMIGSRMYGSTTNNPHQHDNAFFEYSAMISREVAAIQGVSAAIVMLTDKNAYVGMALSRSGLGTVHSSQWEQDLGGTTEGVYNNDTGSPYWDNSKLVTPYNSYLSVNDYNQISEELKQTIAKKVRTLSPRTEEVHISANMDFTNEMVEYAKEAWSGRPLYPWIDQFNILMRHQFANGQIMPIPLDRVKQLRAQRQADGNRAMTK